MSWEIAASLVSDLTNRRWQIDGKISDEGGGLGGGEVLIKGLRQR